MTYLGYDWVVARNDVVGMTYLGYDWVVARNDVVGMTYLGHDWVKPAMTKYITFHPRHYADIKAMLGEQDAIL